MKNPNHTRSSTRLGNYGKKAFNRRYLHISLLLLIDDDLLFLFIYLILMRLWYESNTDGMRKWRKYRGNLYRSSENGFEITVRENGKTIYVVLR